MSRAGLIFMGTGLTLWELRNHCVADNEALDLEMEEPPKPPTVVLPPLASGLQVVSAGSA